MTPPNIWVVFALAVSCVALQDEVSWDQAVVNTSSLTGAYELSEMYNATNFFDKFEFIESKIGTPDYTDVDPTTGFVLYQNRDDAKRLGLIQTVGDVSQIRVDADTVIVNATGYGRKSLRLQSTAVYNHGLFIIDFSHFPPPQCGTWPAFWMKGPDWPTTGELDIYEGWNKYQFNRQSLHTGHNTTVGNCTFNTTSALGLNNFGITNHMYSSNCDIYASSNIGCSTWDYEGPFGSADGGMYAMEWTSTFIKMWTWKPQQVPADVRAGRPDPSSWGLPGLLLAGGSLCDIDRAFKNQSIIINIDLCGTTAGSGAEWASECADKTGYNTCERYVAAHPGDFKDAWFGVRTIKVYDLPPK